MSLDKLSLLQLDSVSLYLLSILFTTPSKGKILWVTPIVMKKGRPAHTLSVLVAPAQAPELAGLVMSMTGSLGVRTRQLDRFVAQRHTVTVSVDGHDIDVKVSDVRVKAEFDQVTVAAEALGLPVQEVAARAETLARDL